MKINFLLGSLILKDHKTGVHFYYEHLIQQMICNNKFDFKISAYESYNSLKNRYKARIPYEKFLLTSFKLARLFTYFLPIEIFFGKANVYICDGLCPITLFKSKKIFIIHDLMVYLYPNNYSLLLRLYLKKFFSEIYKADHVIAVSEATKKDIVKILGVPPAKISVIYNGVEKKEINNDALSIRIKSLFSNKYLFYVGDFRENKNIISAVKGYAEYITKNRDENLYFYIVGNNKGKTYENINKYVIDNGLEDKVIFLGYVSETEKVLLYKNALAFLFVSYYEGFGVPIIEAMLYKTPVITSNCSSMKEIATENSAILVNPNNIQDIAYAIEKVQDISTREALIKNGIMVSKKYTWENSYNQLQALLESFGKMENR